MSKKVFVQSISNCFCTALLMVTMADQLVQSVEVIARKWLDEQPKGKVKHELKLLINKDATDLLSSGAIQRFNAQLQNVMLENEQDIVMNISYRYKEVLKPMDARLRYGVSHVLDAAKVNKNRDRITEMAVALAYHEIYKFMCRNAFEQMHEHEMAIARYPDDADALEKSMRFNENTLESIFRPLDRLYEHLTRGLTFRLKSKEIDHAVTDIAKTLLDLNSLIEVAKDGNTEYDFTVNI